MAEDGLDRSLLKNDNSVEELFKGITSFKISDSSKPFDRQRSMTFLRQSGKIADIIRKGPLKNSKIYTLDESWPTINSIKLATIQERIINLRIYGILTVLPGEGASIWGFRINEKWAGKDKDGILEFNNIIKDQIKSRMWNSAMNKAQSALENKDQSAINTLFLATITTQKDSIPFFGRVAYGIAYSQGIVSLTQIPLMVDSNRNQYFSWSFVPKDSSGVATEEDIENKFGKNGGEKDYDKFVKIRDFLINDCEPLNDKGEYKEVGDKSKNNQEGTTDNNQSDDNKEKDNPENKEDNTNPLVQASNDINQESLSSSVRKSIYIAESYIRKYYLLNEIRDSFSDFDDDDIEDDSVDLDHPKGKPFYNKLKLNNGIPILGPLY